MSAGPESAEPFPSFIGTRSRDAFDSGWRAGSTRKTVSPVAEEVLDEIVLVIEAAKQSTTLTQPE